MSCPQHEAFSAYLTTLSLPPAPTQGPRVQDELELSQGFDRSVYGGAIESQDSNYNDVETQPPHPSSAAIPATTHPGDAWNYSVPVPDSKKNKLIFYKAPFEWGQWTWDQWLAMFFFVKDQLEVLVHKHLRFLDFKDRPVYSPCMVGTCPSEARPSVVVACRDGDFRSIRNLFHARAEEPRLGKVSSISQLHSSLGHRAERTVSTILWLPLVYCRTRTPPVTRNTLSCVSGQVWTYKSRHCRSVTNVRHRVNIRALLPR